MDKVCRAVEILKKSEHTTAFTGAGISVESGIPPFRGENGLWSRYDPRMFDIDYFYSHPAESWKLNKKLFFDVFKQVEPNRAHQVLARMEKEGLLQAVITQNIDNLHQQAGSEVVYEFHGNSRRTVCIECGKKYDIDEEMLSGEIPPACQECGGILKPDFIFFGEGIPETASRMSFAEAQKADVFLIIGTSGVVQPAALVPSQAQKNGAQILEVNTEESNYTDRITDVFLQGKATEMMDRLYKALQDSLEK